MLISGSIKFITAVAIVIAATADVHSDGPTPATHHRDNPYLVCHDLSQLQPVHCTTLDPDTDCCDQWHYNHPPPTPEYPVEGFAEGCDFTGVYHQARADTGCPVQRLHTTDIGVSGICTPSCPKEVYDDIIGPGCGGKHLGRWDKITFYGICK